MKLANLLAFVEDTTRITILVHENQIGSPRCRVLIRSANRADINNTLSLYLNPNVFSSEVERIEMFCLDADTDGRADLVITISDKELLV